MIAFATIHIHCITAPVKYLISAGEVEGVFWCKECDYVTFEVMHLTD